MFDEFALQRKPLIERNIKSALARERRKNATNKTYQDLLQQIMVLIGRGGKRLRPLLFLLAYEGYGGKQVKPALHIASSQELLHAFLLIHDDIIDRDLTRWHGPNITSVYFERFSKTMTAPEALHHAQSQALLAGDVCMALSNQEILTSGFKPEQVAAALKLQSQVILQVLSGEVAESINAPRLPGETEVLEWYRSKTASYSFGLPLRLGALFANAPSSELALLTNFSDSLGVAFQMQDDILGMFGDEAKLGKSVLSDLQEGKRTLLTIKALELAKPRDKRQLEQLLATHEVDYATLVAVQNIVTRSGAREYVVQGISERMQQASDTLEQLGFTARCRLMLQDLLRELQARDY